MFGVSTFTYEYEDIKRPLETYEWDNVWYEHTDRTDVPHVFYIGDSISCGTRQIATAEADQQILFDGYGTSKAVDHPLFADSIRLYAKQLVRNDVVLFNNGLHGGHLTEEEYAVYYEKMVCFLRTEFPSKPLFLVLTTHVGIPARAARARKRNDAVRAIAEKYNLPVIDLYETTCEDETLLATDKVHFQVAGYRLIARKLLAEIQRIL